MAPRGLGARERERERERRGAVPREDGRGKNGCLKWWNPRAEEAEEREEELEEEGREEGKEMGKSGSLR